ncbi:roadblock/LC7 domain-containing protein [Streptomyces sp. NPDC002514]|uniref:roadblock/LC7 domain-containing protein n=1 Tax=Streptomyces sp. NPDC001270 TaxID=3364554 RepID=UPI00369C9334
MSDVFPSDDTLPHEQHMAHAREQLSALLDQLLKKAPGTTGALLGANDGLKMAWTAGQPVDGADSLAAVISGLYSLGRGYFKDTAGGIRQVVVEHDGGSLFVMSAGAKFKNPKAVDSVLAVVATPDADPGQVGHEMLSFIQGLEEVLVVRARTNPFSGSGL